MTVLLIGFVLATILQAIGILCALLGKKEMGVLLYFVALFCAVLTIYVDAVAI